MQSADLSGLLRKLFRAMKVISLVMIAVAILSIGREVVAMGRLAFELHPAAGWLYVAGVAVATWYCVVRPTRSYWSVPMGVRPPDLGSGGIDDASLGDLVRRTRFLEAFAAGLNHNPRLAERAGDIALATTEAARLHRLARTPDCDIVALRSEVRHFETRRIEALLAPLDAEANQVIRAEALAVGLGTAVSMNGTVDAWIVLWRNLNLVAKLAGIYYGRPGIRGTLFVMRDVATAMFIASRLQGVVDHAVGFLGGFFGRAGSVVMGPVADGMLNAFVTVRVGYVAKARCRAFRAWRGEGLESTVRACVKEGASHARGVVSDVFGAARGGLVKVTSDVLGKAGDVFARLFGRGGEIDPVDAL